MLVELALAVDAAQLLDPYDVADVNEVETLDLRWTLDDERLRIMKVSGSTRRCGAFRDDGEGAPGAERCEKMQGHPGLHFAKDMEDPEGGIFIWGAADLASIPER